MGMTLTEKIISAHQDGKKLNVKWITQETNNKFEFAVENIVRKEESSTINLNWNGAPIGVVDKGESQIEVPGLNTFSTMSCRAVRGAREYVALTFSDPIKEPQKLYGLLTIDDHPNLKFTIAGNIVAIYSSSPFVGQVRLNVLPGSFERQDYGIALPGGSPHREVINRALLESLREPAWEELLFRYLGKRD